MKVTTTRTCDVGRIAVEVTDDPPRLQIDFPGLRQVLAEPEARQLAEQLIDGIQQLSLLRQTTSANGAGDTTDTTTERNPR